MRNEERERRIQCVCVYMSVYMCVYMSACDVRWMPPFSFQVFLERERGCEK